MVRGLLVVSQLRGLAELPDAVPPGPPQWWLTPQRGVASLSLWLGDGGLDLGKPTVDVLFVMGYVRTTLLSSLPQVSQVWPCHRDLWA